MKTLIILIIAAGFATGQNVLLIGIDDLNDWIGCMKGHPQVKTPHLDRLAAGGTLFTNAHCQAPLCNPSRTSLMTGLRPTSSGVYGLSPWFRSVPALKDILSMPQAFRRGGYRTAIAGKIYHQYPPGADRTAEFDEYGPPCDFGPFPKEKLVMTPADTRLMDWGVFPERDDQQNDWKIATWAADFLNKPASGKTDAPFFLGIGFGRPHVPCFASQKWFDLYPQETLQMPEIPDGDLADVPNFESHLHWNLPEPRLKWLRESDQWKPLVRSYLASVSFVDSQVGRLLDALRQSPYADNTIVVLFSDHGWHLGEKNISGKNSLWERVSRVPLIISGPGIPTGRRCDQPVELLDIYPTLTDLCKLPPVDALDGLSLRPQLDDPAKPRRPAMTTHNPGNHAVRDEHWRYIHYADGSEELYDHEHDPHEWHNLAKDAAHRQTLERLRLHLPAKETPHVRGSAGRVLENRGGRWFWEGKPVDETEQSL